MCLFSASLSLLKVFQSLKVCLFFETFRSRTAIFLRVTEKILKLRRIFLKGHVGSKLVVDTDVGSDLSI